MSGLLEIKHLTKRFGDTVILNDINITVNKGEVVVILGPSGCGKSTLLRCINALEDIQGGEILIDGGMIGKGERSKAVRDAIVRNHSVYLCAVGGAGALAASCIKQCEVIAFEDLGCESVKRLYVEDFPLIVANDCFGGDIFERGRAEFNKL